MTTDTDGRQNPLATRREHTDPSSVLTRLENPGTGWIPTHHEEAGTGSIPTHRETEYAGRQEHPSLITLPEPLARRYRAVHQRPKGGGEGTLFEVVSQETGKTRVLKLYHSRVRLDHETFRRVQSIDFDHVARVLDFGQLPDGRWYEIQEHLSGGDLLDYQRRMGGSLTDGQLKDVIAQLVEALAAVHTKKLAHHDIKPENILVRQDVPLDLVLTDFGLTVVTGPSTYYAEDTNATVQYQAPETMARAGGQPRDYWALGLTVATLATGTPPYDKLSDYAILKQHAEHIPPPLVESMPDGRIKQLCRGLTRYNKDDRWGIEEVRRWLDGDDPEVVSETAAVARGVSFNRTVFASPTELASEIAANWQLAASVLGVADRRSLFLNEIMMAFGTNELAELDTKWADSRLPRGDVDSAIIGLIIALDPECPATYDGRPLTRDSITAAARSDDAADRRFVNVLCDGILDEWARNDRLAELGMIARELHAEMERAQEIVDLVRRDPIVGNDIPLTPSEWRSPLLAICARPELLEDWRTLARDSAPEGRHVPVWYRDIVDRRRPADVVAATLFAGEAKRLQRVNEERERRELCNRRRRRWDFRLSMRRLSLYAFFGALLFEAGTARVDGSGFFPLGWPLFNLELPLLVLVITILVRNADGPRWGELLGFMAGAGILYWYLSGPAPYLGVDQVFDSISSVRQDDSLSLLDFFTVEGCWFFSVVLYSGSGVASLMWSVSSFAVRQFDRIGNGPPSRQQIAILVEQDRTTLRRLAWVTLTCVTPAALGLILLVISPSQDLSFDRLVFLFRASPWNVLIAMIVYGVWLPVLVAGLILLVRGRWSHRPAGSIWALVLLLAAGIAWPASRAFADTNISEAHHATVTTPVSEAVVDGGRFCGRYWTVVHEPARTFPVRTFLAGEACDTLYQYGGWYENWSVSLSQHSVDDLLSIDGTNIVIVDRSMAIGFSSTGDRIWDYRCDGAITIDESQLDGGPDTPDGQVFAGTCDSPGTGTGEGACVIAVAGACGVTENPFRLDPSTGNSLTLPSDTTAAPATSTTVRLGDGRDELVGDSSTRQPATSTTIPPNPGDAVSCAHFDNHAAAQEWYDTYWPHYGDVALIDINDNGVACEKLLTETEKATTTTRRTTDGNAP